MTALYRLLSRRSLSYKLYVPSFNIYFLINLFYSLVFQAHDLSHDSFALPSSSPMNVSPSSSPNLYSNFSALTLSSPINVSPTPPLPLLSSSQPAIDDKPPPTYMSPPVTSELILEIDDLDSEFFHPDLSSHGPISSSPPSSSPTQIFTSSPFVSSQSSELPAAPESDKVEHESSMV